MILPFKSHFKDGSPTYFKEKIYAGVVVPAETYTNPTSMIKIHSLREGERWSKGIVLHMAYGVRTKNYIQFNKGIESLSTCTGTQDVYMTVFRGILEVSVDDRYLRCNEIDQLISNDGLTEEQFFKWFFPNANEKFWSGKIVHWTDYRY